MGLKVELEKRGLPKSGNKNDLIERLSHYLMKQTQNQNMGHQESYPAQEQVMRSPGMGSPGAQPPNMSLSHGLADNDFVRDYLKMRETQFASAISDQDAHLQSNKVEQPMDQMVGIPGHVENQHMNNQVVAPIQNQIHMEKQGVMEPAANSLSYQEPVAPQKVATNQAVQHYGQMGASLHETAQVRQPVQNFNTITEQKTNLSRNEHSIEPENISLNVSNALLEDQIIEPVSTQPDDSGKETSEATLNALNDAVQEKTEEKTETSTSENDAHESKSLKEINSKEKVNNVVKNEQVQNIEKEVQGEKEKVGTPDCDEIVVSHYPILADFEETMDEEISKTKEDSLPEAPPPDTTFRKLSRPISNDNSVEDQKKKKRQWGRKENKDLNKEDENSTDMVSGELLKDIVPDVKPYLEDLGKEEDLDHEQETEEEEVNGDEIPSKTRDREEGIKEPKKEESGTSQRQISAENSNSSVREAEKSKRVALDKLNPERSCVIEVRNLVRPFTLIQFKELLLRTGKINRIEDGGFWIDKIKSHAIVEYESPDEADETVMALDGVKWPSTNPKTLSVTFSTKSILDKAINENNVPTRHIINKEYSQKMRSQDENGDQLYKRKY